MPEKNASEDEIWGPKGYFFAESGTHNWSELAGVVAKEAHKQRLIGSSETKELDVELAKKRHGFESLSWGLNSKGRAKRAAKYLGWQPTHPSLVETIPDAVRSIAQERNSRGQ